MSASATTRAVLSLAWLRTDEYRVLVDRFGADGKRIVVLAAPGDRRDEDIRDIAAAAAGHFDHYICRCDDNRRGRGYDEVAVVASATELLPPGLASNSIGSGISMSITCVQ